MPIHIYDEHEMIRPLTEEDKNFIDSLPPTDVWWNNMQEKIKRSNERWAKKNATERANGIYN